MINIYDPVNFTKRLCNLFQRSTCLGHIIICHQRGDSRKLFLDIMPHAARLFICDFYLLVIGELRLQLLFCQASALFIFIICADKLHIGEKNNIDI